MTQQFQFDFLKLTQRLQFYFFAGSIFSLFSCADTWDLVEFHPTMALSTIQHVHEWIAPHWHNRLVSITAKQIMSSSLAQFWFHNLSSTQLGNHGYEKHLEFCSSKFILMAGRGELLVGWNIWEEIKANEKLLKKGGNQNS